MMKIEMRVTWMRVGDPNPQTAGWFDPQADNLTIELPLGGALLRFCSASNAPRTVSPPSRRSHIATQFRNPFVHTLHGWRFGAALAHAPLFLLAQAKRTHSYRVQMHIPAQGKPPFLP